MELDQVIRFNHLFRQIIDEENNFFFTLFFDFGLNYFPNLIFQLFSELQMRLPNLILVDRVVLYKLIASNHKSQYMPYMIL